MTGNPEAAPTPGASHLVWIARFQWILLGLGMSLWILRSWRASLVFSVSGLCSILFWHLHCWLVPRMLTPSLRLRWFYAILGLLKLALIVGVLRAMMGCFPGKTLPLATGILLFVGSILLEAIRLMLHPSRQDLE